MRLVKFIGITALLLTIAIPGYGQHLLEEIEEVEELEEEAGTSDLAKAAQNPVGDLISLPVQNNMSFGAGPDDRVLNVMNIQPVVPVKLSENWNLITRTILPVISAPVPGVARTNGIGDLNFTGFFSPRKPGKLIWVSVRCWYFPPLQTN